MTLLRVRTATMCFTGILASTCCADLPATTSWWATRARVTRSIAVQGSTWPTMRRSTYESRLRVGPDETLRGPADCRPDHANNKLRIYYFFNEERPRCGTRQRQHPAEGECCLGRRIDSHRRLSLRRCRVKAARPENQSVDRSHD